MYYSPASAENCIRGFFHLGFQASYAQVSSHRPPPLKHTADLNQKSRNSRLKDLEDRSSTNIYCTGVPIDWNESVSLIMGQTAAADEVAGSCQALSSLPCRVHQNLS
jgi:hypothetical protein